MHKVWQSTVRFERRHRIRGSSFCGSFESVDHRRSRKVAGVGRFEQRYINGQNMWMVVFARFDMKEFSAREARYGLRGVRIGEASHPGPPKFGRCGSRSRNIILASVSSPDSDEPLISRRPGLRRSRDESRNVTPRVDFSDPGETVLSIPRRLIVAPQSSEDDLRTTNRFAALRAEKDSARQRVRVPVMGGSQSQGMPGQCRRGCG